MVPPVPPPPPPVPPAPGLPPLAKPSTSRTIRSVLIPRSPACAKNPWPESSHETLSSSSEDDSYDFRNDLFAIEFPPTTGPRLEPDNSAQVSEVQALS